MMRQFLILAVTAIMLHGTMLQKSMAQDNPVKYQYTVRQVPIETVIIQISELTGKKFAYSPQQIDTSQRISCRIKAKDLPSLLDGVFLKNQVFWEIIDNQIVLKRLTTERIAETIKPISLSGTVRDAATGELLPGVRVIIDGKPNIILTNAYGFFSTKLPGGRHRIAFVIGGYTSLTEDISLESPLMLRPALTPLTVSYEPVDITAGPLKNFPGAHNSNLMDALTGFGGQGDVIKAINSLPGFQLFGDGSTLFHVRGGQSNQNLILIDEAPIYNPSHMFGFFSAFSPEAIREVKAWKGDQPARYGGRLSSVIDIHSREGNQHKYGLSGNLGPFASSLTLEGPIRKERSSFIISARRSNMEWLRPTQYSPESFYFNFYDVHAKLNAQINTRNRLYLTVYSGGDNFSRLTESSLKTYGISWGNLTGTLRWNYIPHNTLFINSTLIFSNYNYYLFLNGLQTDFWKSSIQARIFKTDLSWYIKKNSTIRAGLEFGNHLSDPGNITYTQQDKPEFRKKFPMYRSLTAQAYLSSETRLLNEKVLLDIGIRVPVWLNYGPFTVYYYNATYEPFATANIPADSAYYIHTGLEPRCRFEYQAGRGITAMVSYSRNLQYMQSLSNSASPFTTLETWAPAGPVIGPQQADLLSGGVSLATRDGRYTVVAEVYQKWMNNQIDYKDHANLLYNQHLEGQLRFGSSSAHGVEFMLRKNTGKMTGWLAYTYSRAVRTTSGLNRDKPYRPFYDRPHQGQIVMQYKPNQRLGMQIAWYYMSGGTTTIPDGFYNLHGYLVPVYTEKNNTRLPDYHRMDLSAEFQLNKPGNTFRHSLVLSVYNLYGRFNPFIINFNKIMDDKGNYVVPDNLASGNPVVPTELSVAGFIPSIHYKFSF
jgi:hypothetical protein